MMSEKDIFDPDVSLRNKLRALGQHGTGAGFLLDRIAEELHDRLGVVEKHFHSAVALHCLTDAAAQAVRRSGKAGSIVRIEPHAAFLNRTFPGAVCPAELVPLAGQCVDLIVSLLTLHETNDTPGLLAQIRRSLRPDGLFLAALAGGETLFELRESLLAAEAELLGGASPRVIPFADVRDLGGLLQRAGFALPVADCDSYTVRYDTMFDLMHDLRAMGAGNFLATRPQTPGRRSMFLRAAQIYAERHSDPDGRIRATFSIVWLSGWAPHESQQKPLKPGSGQVSLARVLGK
jgi:SAM-dependent methyltransferase